VQQLVVRDKGDATVVVRGGAQVPCSRQHRAELVARLDRRAVP
jgi:two-component system, LytTR family, response regulator